MKGKIIAIIMSIAIVGIPLIAWMSQLNDTIIEIPSRESKIPNDAVKMTPEMDFHPPITVSDE
jgi:hypothetical protein